MKNILDYDVKMLEEFCLENKIPKFNGKVIFKWLHQMRVESFDDMTNISKVHRQLLFNNFEIYYPELITKQKSSDGTIKFLFELSDGEKIETVLMSHGYGNSVCVTTQVGCNMKCSFCASGVNGKVRDLSAGEIIGQLLCVKKEIGDDSRISSVVYMGIGEPFDNYENMKLSLKMLISKDGLNIGSRHITVSTSGLIKEIVKFADDFPQVGLAISLHAPNDKVRSKIMKINDVYNMEELMDACIEYQNITNRRISFEYLLMRGVNDTFEHAKQLKNLLRGTNTHVNLIPFNAVDESGYKRSTRKDMDKFLEVLEDADINVTMRREQGHDIDAACGQLRNKNNVL